MDVVCSACLFRHRLVESELAATHEVHPRQAFVDPPMERPSAGEARFEEMMVAMTSTSLFGAMLSHGPCQSESQRTTI